jgi:predicted transposase YdaD
MSVIAISVYPDSIAKVLLEGVRKMKESTTYQAILREGKAEGRLEEAKRILLRQGRKRFGQPKAAVKSKIDAIADLAQLERLSDRVLDATSWDELIDGA